MSNAVSTTGILVKRALIASPTVFTTIAELTKVTPSGFSRNKIETSTHNDGTESYILGILRQKDAAFTINYVAGDATHISVLADINANTKNQWQIAFPSGTTLTGPARVQQFMYTDATVDGSQSADVILTWAGPVVQA